MREVSHWNKESGESFSESGSNGFRNIDRKGFWGMKRSSARCAAGGCRNISSDSFSWFSARFFPAGIPEPD